jgi:hypothetical protein
MKIGKGSSSVLGTPLSHIAFVLLGFFFGFLSAISFNQVIITTYQSAARLGSRRAYTYGRCTWRLFYFFNTPDCVVGTEAPLSGL